MIEDNDMNLIDTDRIGIGAITPRHHDSSVKDNSSAKVLTKQDDNQIQSLMSLIKNAPPSAVYESRFEQLKAQIQGNYYEIDYHALSNNLLAADYEL